MKYFNSYIALAALSLSIVACDDDIDTYKVSELSQSTVELESGDNIVISSSNLSSVVLQMTYSADGNELYLTNSYSETVLGDGVYILEVATSSDFKNATSTTLDGTIKGANDITYTGQELNILAKNLGLGEGESGKLYFRVGHAYNTDDIQKVVYSETLTITVTPLYIDMHFAYILDTDQTTVRDTLYSENEDNIYTGFFPTSAEWDHFYILDGLNQMWGNYGEDGNFARCDLVSNSAWNFWTAGTPGCLYITFDTNSGNQYITFTALTTLEVSGGAEASLTLDYSTGKWAGTIETTTDNAAIRLSGTTKTNDNGTGDGTSNAVESTMSFALNGEYLEIASTAGDITIPTAGQYLLSVDLSGRYYTYSLTDMSGTTTYASTVYAVIDGEQVELETEISGGLPSGVYTGTVTTSADATEVTLVDADGNTLATYTVETAGTYILTLDLTASEDEQVTIANSTSDVMYIYLDEDYTSLKATYYQSWDADGNYLGYSGFLYQVDTWNFWSMDGNGVTYGPDGNWGTTDFFSGYTNNCWVSTANTSYFAIFDTDNSTWSYTEVTSLSLTGDFNSWSLTSDVFTDNGDGTWSTTITAVEEQWGPYICINGEWTYHVLIAEDGSTLAPGNGSFITSGAGTYTVTVDMTSNTVSVVSAE